MKTLSIIGAGMALLVCLSGCADYFDGPPERPPARISVPPLPPPPPASSQKEYSSQR